MNERIKELLKQSGAYDHYQIMEGLRSDEKPIEKFAELIVKECGIVADNWVANEDNGKNLVSDRLKQHFA